MGTKPIPAFVVKCEGKQIGKIYFDRSKCESFLLSLSNRDKCEIVESVWYI